MTHTAKIFRLQAREPTELDEVPVSVRGRDVHDVLDMMCHIADVNARERRNEERRRGALAVRLVTEAVLENQEWDAFAAKVEKRNRLFIESNESDGTLPAAEHASALDATDTDEDDADMLLCLIDVLERARDRGFPPRTVSELARTMQSDRVLAVEFSGAARAQCQRLLDKLRDLNKVYQDQHGRWSLL